MMFSNGDILIVEKETSLINDSNRVNTKLSVNSLYVLLAEKYLVGVNDNLIYIVSEEQLSNFIKYGQVSDNRYSYLFDKLINKYLLPTDIDTVNIDLSLLNKFITSVTTFPFVVDNKALYDLVYAINLNIIKNTEEYKLIYNNAEYLPFIKEIKTFLNNCPKDSFIDRNSFSVIFNRAFPDLELFFSDLDNGKYSICVHKDGVILVIHKVK